MPIGICTAKRRLWVDGDGAPGKGQRANRNALAPSPGFRTVREWYFKRNRKHHEIPSAPHLKTDVSFPSPEKKEKNSRKKRKPPGGLGGDFLS